MASELQGMAGAIPHRPLNVPLPSYAPSTSTSTYNPPIRGSSLLWISRTSRRYATAASAPTAARSKVTLPSCCCKLVKRWCTLDSQNDRVSIVTSERWRGGEESNFLYIDLCFSTNLNDLLYGVGRTVQELVCPCLVAMATGKLHACGDGMGGESGRETHQNRRPHVQDQALEQIRLAGLLPWQQLTRDPGRGYVTGEATELYGSSSGRACIQRGGTHIYTSEEWRVGVRVCEGV